MRLLEPVRVTVLEGQVPTLQFAGPLLLEIPLSHHVQVSVRRQLCSRRRLLSRLLADCISRPLFCRSAMSGAMSVEGRHATHDERRRSHHHKKTHRFKLSGHNWTPDLIPARLGRNRTYGRQNRINPDLSRCGRSAGDRRPENPNPISNSADGGVVLALVPGLPAIHLDPQLVFNLFLPPLLYPAAVYTSWRDFRANLRSLLPLAIVLVLLTMTATAYLFHGLVGLPLAVGFVFGAIISPPDAVAALAVTQTLRVPRKIIVILEGESLINDATSFISFRFAVSAVMTGAFSLGH